MISTIFMFLSILFMTISLTRMMTVIQRRINMRYSGVYLMHTQEVIQDDMVESLVLRDIIGGYPEGYREVNTTDANRIVCLAQAFCYMMIQLAINKVNIDCTVWKTPSLRKVLKQNFTSPTVCGHRMLIYAYDLYMTCKCNQLEIGNGIDEQLKRIGENIHDLKDTEVVTIICDIADRFASFRCREIMEDIINATRTSEEDRA